MTKLRLAILWHMHQPFYLDPMEGHFSMPWMRLHSLKDYLDMPLVAAEREGVAVNFNLVPSLVEQWRAWKDGGRDRVQELCDRPVTNLSAAEREELTGLLFRAHPETMIAPLPEYAALHRSYLSEGVGGIAEADLVRLKYLYHLAWLDPLFWDESVPARFLSGPEEMSEAAWPAFRTYLDGFPDRILETYRRLHRDGRIEVSVSPFYHPILPLLVDTRSAFECMPDVELPEESFRFPEDARWQLRRAKETAREWLGVEAAGIWPSEGSVSEEVLRIAAEEGFAWAASDEQVLAQSCGLANLKLPGAERAALLYRPHRRRFGDLSLDLVFRDHFLSDRIGFSYASWEPEDAVEDFISHLERIAREAAQDEPLVPVILDGENCWEYYQSDGLPFLRALYERLAETDWIELASISRHLEELEPRELGPIRAGSWIGGNFSIWIGQPEDNRSWDYLARVRRDLVDFGGGAHPLDDAPLSPELEKAWRSLFVAEGSDWNWWYGTDHSSLDDADFDRLYRAHLRGIYDLLGKEAPAFLSEPIPDGLGRRGELLPLGHSEVQVDGKVSHFYEWQNAAQFQTAGQGAAMTRVDRLVDSIWMAFGEEAFFVRVDFNVDSRDRDIVQRLSLDFHGPFRRRFRFDLLDPEACIAEESQQDRWASFHSEARCAVDEILELAIPWRELPARSGQELFFTLTFLGEAGIVEVEPAAYPLVFHLPESHYDRIMWKV